MRCEVQDEVIDCVFYDAVNGSVVGSLMEISGRGFESHYRSC